MLAQVIIIFCFSTEMFGLGSVVSSAALTASGLAKAIEESSSTFTCPSVPLTFPYRETGFTTTARTSLGSSVAESTAVPMIFSRWVAPCLNDTVGGRVATVGFSGLFCTWMASLPSREMAAWFLGLLEDNVIVSCGELFCAVWMR